MNHAVQSMAQHPAMTYGKIFEIRPAGDMNGIMEASEQRGRKRIPRDEDGHEERTIRIHGRGWSGGTHISQLA